MSHSSHAIAGATEKALMVRNVYIFAAFAATGALYWWPQIPNSEPAVFIAPGAFGLLLGLLIVKPRVAAVAVALAACAIWIGSISTAVFLASRSRHEGLAIWIGLVLAGALGSLGLSVVLGVWNRRLWKRHALGLAALLGAGGAMGLVAFWLPRNIALFESKTYVGLILWHGVVGLGLEKLGRAGVRQGD